MPVKRCSACGAFLGTERFSKNRRTPDGLQAECRICQSTRRKAATKAGKRWATTEWRRRKKLRLRYGITAEQFDSLLAAQGGKCAVCDVVLEMATSARCGPSTANVDHDHATGLVRGILCWPCNLQLGILEARPEVTEKLLRYAARHALQRRGT